MTAEGRTGVPFVDANMRELAMTGFMSNRGRQNVASFLTKDLGLDWRMGAEWFEYLLVRSEGQVNKSVLKWYFKDITNYLINDLLTEMLWKSRISFI